MNDYWTLTNISYQNWIKYVDHCKQWPLQAMFQGMAARSQADYVMYLALQQYEINHGNRKI